MPFSVRYYLHDVPRWVQHRNNFLPSGKMCFGSYDFCSMIGHRGPRATTGLMQQNCFTCLLKQGHTSGKFHLNIASDYASVKSCHSLPPPVKIPVGLELERGALVQRQSICFACWSRIQPPGALVLKKQQQPR